MSLVKQAPAVLCLLKTTATVVCFFNGKLLQGPPAAFWSRTCDKK